MNNYTNSKLQVKWNNIKSEMFSCSNGVKQGGVLSPILFAIYVDDLLNTLRLNGNGCHVNTMFCGAFAYADDIVLLSPTVYGLNNMANICQVYGKEYDIMFNPNKSQLITFTNKKNIFRPSITIDDKKVLWVNNVNQLGHKLYCEFIVS